MIFLRVLPKNFLWPTIQGLQELGGPGSLNRLSRLNPGSYATNVSLVVVRAVL